MPLTTYGCYQWGVSHDLASPLVHHLLHGSGSLDLAVALLAEEEQDGLRAEEVIAALDDLAVSLHVREGANSFEAVARLNQRLFSQIGFAGDAGDYYNPQNSFLDRVITRKRGLPIALAVIYLEVARRAGVVMDGIGFPGHFLVGTRATADEPRFFVDPFYAGQIHTEDELRGRLKQMELAGRNPNSFLDPSSNTEIVLRMTYNLKGSYLRLRRHPDALRQIDRVLKLAPERTEEHRDRGLLLAEMGEVEEALVALSVYLELTPQAHDRDIISDIMVELSH